MIDDYYGLRSSSFFTPEPVATIKIENPKVRTCANSFCENTSDKGAFGTFQTRDAVVDGGYGITLHMCGPCLTALGRVIGLSS